MGLSIWQVLLILLVVLIFFGPSRIPGLGKSLGEAIRGFKKGLDDDEIDVTPSSEQINANNETQQKQQQTQTTEQEKS